MWGGFLLGGNLRRAWLLEGWTIGGCNREEGGAASSLAQHGLQESVSRGEAEIRAWPRLPHLDEGLHGRNEGWRDALLLLNYCNFLVELKIFYSVSHS